MNRRLEKVRDVMEPPWDEVREQRVLTRIQERRTKTPIRKSRRSWKVPALSGAAATILLVVGAMLLWRLWGGSPSRKQGARQHARPARPRTERVQPSELAFGNAGRALLSDDAKVEIVTHDTKNILVRQRRGKVRYEIRHDPHRRFVVDAAGVLIRDLGTIFEVSIQRNESVRVAVQEGIVEVKTGDGWTKLSSGMALDIPNTNQSAPPEPNTGDTPTPRVRPGARLWSGASRTKQAAKPNIDELLDRMDDARRAGRLTQAARLLRTIISTFPRDPRITAALFTLGRVEEALGHHLRAARAYHRCWHRSPHGALAEDALAAEAKSLSHAGRTDRARAAASRYLKRYPHGAHAAKMRKLVAPGQALQAPGHHRIRAAHAKPRS